MKSIEGTLKASSGRFGLFHVGPNHYNIVNRDTGEVVGKREHRSTGFTLCMHLNDLAKKTGATKELEQANDT